ncbi:MAG: Gfo/Idh/MocA family oxidoreductase [Bacteroidia bacterium]|nr:Gfo/Idh/MocA family oxidoreductase [Bacteroidia bacterium]
MIKIGLLGAGHLGKIHLKLLKEIPEFQVVGFYDASPEVRLKVEAEFQVKAFSDISSLLDAAEAVDIVTPTLSHFDCMVAALEKGLHVFVEKPLTHTVGEAEKLREIAAENPGLKIQVGHVERFNPAFLAVNQASVRPVFIEGHRLAVYNPRGTDVSVVLDLMIHDLDVILSLVKAPVRSISASGVAVISESPDIANARIEFANGCVANLTASRISIKNMRRLRIFQKNTYLAVDFLKKSTEVFRLAEPDEEGLEGKMKFEFNRGDDKKFLLFEQPEVKPVNAIQMELEEFAASILRHQPIRVSLEDGYRALKVAHEILAEIDRNTQAYDPVF